MAQNTFVGIDLFSGAGGMSVGAAAAGITVKAAVEIDRFAAHTFQMNHPHTLMINGDIRAVHINGMVKAKKSDIKVLFGGPPCQGFSTSNQRTRGKLNVNNWLFEELLRITKEENPDWVIVENVKGIVETEKGFFLEKIIADLFKIGYTSTFEILNAADFGVPQTRNRIFIVGSRHGIKFKFPGPKSGKTVSVREAISDLPTLSNGANQHIMEYKTPPQSSYQNRLRGNSGSSTNNLVTRNTQLVLQRYEHIPPGGNWENVPPRLMKNYKDFSRCHTGIYHRLQYDKPSVVIGNYRKNMLIHPEENRGLSVREAARIQSFPDTFHFFGSIGFQQQQVGNSVPPILAQAIFEQLVMQ